jgi:hypothetical protein
MCVKYHSNGTVDKSYRSPIGAVSGNSNIYKLSDRIIIQSGNQLYQKVGSAISWEPVQGKEYAAKHLGRTTKVIGDTLFSTRDNADFSLYLSPDRGQSWSKTVNPLTTFPINDFCKTGNDIYTLGVQDSVVRINVVFHSHDMGAKWKVLSKLPTAVGYEYIEVIDSVLFIARSPLKAEDTAFVGVARTIDGGVTWQSITKVSVVSISRCSKLKEEHCMPEHKSAYMLVIIMA